MQIFQSPRNEKEGLISFYWGIVLSAFVAFFILLLAVDRINEKNDFYFDRNLALLAPIEAHKDSRDITMVLLGNSRLRYALLHGFEPDKPIRLPDGRNLWIVQFAEDVALFRYYEKLWPYILKSKPDYIVLQDLVLTTARAQKIATRSLTDISATLYVYFEHLVLRRTPEEQWLRDRYDVADKCEENYNRATMQDRVIFTAHRDQHAIEGNENIVHAREALAQALAVGIEVIILQLPPNIERIAPFNLPLHVVDRYGLGYTPTREQLLPDLHDKVSWIEYPPSVPDNYCDYVHLNQQGRQAFSSWFLDIL